MTKILCCRGCQMNQVMPNGVFCTKQPKMGLSQLTFTRDVMESHQLLWWSKVVRMSLVAVRTSHGPHVSNFVVHQTGQNAIPSLFLGVMNGPLKFLSARKILPLLDLLAKFKRVLACLCSQTFCSFSQARFLVSIARNSVNPFLG